MIFLDHPFQAELDLDVEALLRVDDIQGAIQVLMGHLLFLIDLLRSLFLIANVFDSFKFGLLLYALTYVGEAFNLLTIFIIALVLLFTVPKVGVMDCLNLAIAIFCGFVLEWLVGSLVRQLPALD